jgi:ATP-dependent DNA helicase RecG
MDTPVTGFDTMTQNTDITYIKGIGPEKAKLLAKLGIFSLKDIISYFPRDYEDRREIKQISALAAGENICVAAELTGSPKLIRSQGGRQYVKCQASDGTGVMDITFFNQPWMKNTLKTGKAYIFYGKVGGNLLRRDMVNPLFEETGRNRITGKILPVYRLTAGVGQQTLTAAIQAALEHMGENLDDALPASVREEYDLCHSRFAYETIHFPESFEALAVAKRRLIFEEFFILSLGLKMMKTPKSKAGIKAQSRSPEEFTRALPFALTRAQQRAVGDIFADLVSGTQMNRLVQGDVGSGKTVIAAAAAWLLGVSGYQTAFMAPTEILAAQHYSSLAPLFEALGLRTLLLTGSMTRKAKDEVKEMLSQGLCDVVIGTHALISEDVEYCSLGLVITDEQHRFGVRQRAALSQKGASPHVLVMSATPIPRTLALIMYGDLDISVINELPPGRQVIKTYTVGEAMRTRINRFIEKLVSQGRQVYIVCSLVEGGDETDDEGRKAVEAYAEALRTKIFPKLKIGFIHGKLKQKAKDEAMSLFSRGETDILVSTTVIEVGIDVPNAALIVIENAERFGLSQLHQLRGRVGRGAHESFCILFSESESEATRARLGIMASTSDGFVIAEEDLKLRGPGDFFGNRQHGLPLLKIADFASDAETLYMASNEAEKLLKSDPSLEKSENTLIKNAVNALFKDGAEV